MNNHQFYVVHNHLDVSFYLHIIIISIFHVAYSASANPSPSPPISNETCMALQEISGKTQGSLVGTCGVTMDCSTLLCSTTTGYTGNFEILPCNNPPGIHSTLFDQQQNKVYDEILTDTTTLTLGTNTLVIDITQLSDGIGLKVSSQHLT